MEESCPYCDGPLEEVCRECCCTHIEPKDQAKTDAFLADLFDVMRRHGVSITAEYGWPAFVDEGVDSGDSYQVFADATAVERFYNLHKTNTYN